VGVTFWKGDLIGCRGRRKVSVPYRRDGCLSGGRRLSSSSPGGWKDAQVRWCVPNGHLVTDRDGLLLMIGMWNSENTKDDGETGDIETEVVRDRRSGERQESAHGTDGKEKKRLEVTAVEID
jgi:hypothetical protein